MKSPRTKEDLIEKVMEQMEIDFHCADIEAIEELLTFCPIENLVAYLPEDESGPFRSLERSEHRELRTENALTNLITQYPNDQELGEQIRMRYGRNN